MVFDTKDLMTCLKADLARSTPLLGATSESEKERSRPFAAGDDASNLRERTVVPFAVQNPGRAESDGRGA